MRIGRWFASRTAPAAASKRARSCGATIMSCPFRHCMRRNPSAKIREVFTLQPSDAKNLQAPAEVTSQTGRTLLNLREMILRGDFPPGERISELPMVARLGVSRTPIRLALDRLANEGLLEVLPGGG